MASINKKFSFMDIYLPIYPIVQAYSDTLSLLLFVIYAFIKISSTKSLKINYVYFLFIALTLINHLLLLLIDDSMSTYHFMIQLRNMSMFSFIIFALYQSINIESFVIIYRIIAILLGILILYQFVEIFLFHKLISPFTFFGLTFSESYYVNSTRPMGFFTEPQKVATYLIPLVILELKNKKYWFSVFITLLIFLSMSVQGIVTILLIHSIYQIKAFSNKITMKTAVVLASLVLILLSASFFDQFTIIFTRLSYLGFSYSDYLRLFKGLDTFKELPFSNIFLGVGLNNLSNYISINQYSFSWMGIVSNESVYSYMSTGFGIFVEVGIISGILFYAFLYTNRGKDLTSLLLIISMVVQMFSQTFIFNYAFIFYLLIIMAYNEMYYANNNYNFILTFRRNK